VPRPLLAGGSVLTTFSYFWGVGICKGIYNSGVPTALYPELPVSC
jgi:hypothetical protein